MRHRADVIGCVLANTAVHQPRGASAPRLIRMARWSPARDLLTRRSPVFTRGTTALSAVRGRSLPRDVVAAYAAPYLGAERRAAVSQFVADIPLESDHPSAQVLSEIADGVRGLDVPVLLSWGADDPVFSDRHLRDLLDRIPHADVHRYERAGHLVTEEAPAAIDDIIRWIEKLLQGKDSSRATSPEEPAVPDRLVVARDDAGVAVAELATGRRVGWSMLSTRVREIAAGLTASGVRPGDRVALLIPPGADLVAAVYACWATGAGIVVADRGLGVSGMRRAIRGSGPDHIIAITPGLAITRDLDIPGLRILAGSASPAARRALGAADTLAALAARGREAAAAPAGQSWDRSSLALIAFTSGSTGPAKGVAYSRARVSALIDAIARSYAIDPQVDALVAAFAPWVVLGPALGIASALPDMDVTDPSTLTMASFTAAADAVGGTIAWTSPTGVRALVDTAAATTHRPESLRLLMVAGAPTPVSTLEAAGAALPGTRIATPYGMTEALPLTEVSLEELVAVGPGNGVLVGHPLDGVEVRIDPLDTQGSTGEIIVRAPWSKQTYDRRWAIEDRTAAQGWHRTGDVGHLDAQGRLWVEGRLGHVITTVRGPVTPVAAEEAAAAAAGTPLAGCVAVGPRGRQVVVIVLPGGRRRMEPASVELTVAVRDAVRLRCGVDVAAVLTIAELPVDIRHRSKIDRARLARQAARALEGSAGRAAAGDDRG
jgi:olefin beta-lactone synthetase